MKSFKTKNLVIIGVTVAVIGAILLFGGFVMGGFSNYVTFENGRFQAVSNKLETQTKTLNSSVKYLRIDAAALKVTVKIGNEFSVTSRLSNRRLDVVNSGNGEGAVISTPNKSNFPFFSFGNFGFEDQSLVITVPDAKQLEQLSIDLDASSGIVDGLDLTNLSGELAASNLTVDNASAKTIKFNDVDASKLRFNNFTLQNSGNISMTAGHLFFNSSHIPALSARGDASKLKIDGQTERLPYGSATSRSVLKIDMDASSAEITD